MFLLNGNTLSQGTPFKDANGTQYPANWLNLSTAEEKAAIGITEVADPAIYNDKFYWSVDNPKDLFTCQSNEVNATNAAVFSLLSPTDYIDIRNLRDATYKPEWMTWRDTIRTQAKAQVLAITSCATIEELAALPNVDWAKDPNAPA